MPGKIHEVRKWLDDRLREAFLIRYSGFFLYDGVIFIPVPEWEGWRHVDLELREPSHHLARWEMFPHPGSECFWLFLRITWPSVPRILLGFLHPDDLRPLEAIASYRRLALMDRPLHDGAPHPFSSGIMVHDIPADVPGAFGIGPGDGATTIH